MIVEVKVPEVGESVTEGLLTAWLKQDGEVVMAEEELFELETDKVTMAIPAEVPGRLATLVAEGAQVKIGQTVAQIETDAAEKKGPSEPPLKAEEESKAAEEFRPAEKPKEDVGQGPPISAPAGMEQVKAKLAKEGEAPPLSPAVRRMVEEHRLDPGKIDATGKGGRITKGDVVEHLAEKPPKVDEAERPAKVDEAERPPKVDEAERPPKVDEAERPPKAAAKPEAAAPVAPTKKAAPTRAEAAGRETRVALSPLRQRITERLVQVQQTAAILTTFNEVDMTNVMAFRGKHKDKFEKQFDVRLGFMSFFVKAVVDALRTVPQLNARIEKDEIVYQHYYDIGIAVGTEQGLVVPVIRNAEKLSFAEIEKRINDFADRARKRRLKLDELMGGCFTISNGGIYGSLLSTPILNPPQSGILGMHRIQKRAVVVNDEIVIRPMMYLALSYDHRIVDGAEAVTFLKRIVECIDDPERILLEV